MKRVYEKPAHGDGTRVLVDRLWPRGLSKEAAAVDLWLRELAPSNELRKWYHENREAWASFRRKYFRKLKRPEAKQALQQLYDLMSRKKPVTLLFASTNLERNNAVALKEIVEGQIGGKIKQEKTERTEGKRKKDLTGGNGEASRAPTL